MIFPVWMSVVDIGRCGMRASDSDTGRRLIPSNQPRAWIRSTNTTFRLNNLVEHIRIYTSYIIGKLQTHFENGEHIIRQFQPGDTFYIISKGKVCIPGVYRIQWQRTFYPLPFELSQKSWFVAIKCHYQPGIYEWWWQSWLLTRQPMYVRTLTEGLEYSILINKIKTQWAVSK